MKKKFIVATIAYLMTSQSLSAEESAVKLKLEEKLPILKDEDSKRLQTLIENNLDQFSPETLELVKKISDRRNKITIHQELSVPDFESLMGRRIPRKIDMFGDQAGPKDQAGH